MTNHPLGRKVADYAAVLRARREYLKEELARRGVEGNRRWDFLSWAAGRIPESAEPEVLDAFLDREMPAWEEGDFGSPVTSGGLSGWRVRCPSCEIRTEDFKVHAEAIAAWNRRSPAPPPTLPTREELARALYEAWFKDTPASLRPKLEVPPYLSKWLNEADAAFRAFGLEPPKGESPDPPIREGCCKHGALVMSRCEECEEKDHGA